MHCVPRQQSAFTAWQATMASFLVSHFTHPSLLPDPTQTARETHFCQTAQQLLGIASTQLRVQLAAGGDPTYAFNVKMVGEEVMGTSGSFRHFLWQVITELQSSRLQLLMPCPSSAAGVNKVWYLLPASFVMSPPTSVNFHLSYSMHTGASYHTSHGSSLTHTPPFTFYVVPVTFHPYTLHHTVIY